MPRVANPPRAKDVSTATPRKQVQQSPLKIPLNDDRQEKAVRLQSRQALHDLQMNSLKAAASPTQRSSEATLAPSFASLQLKKFELEFSVDPLFKKASADFDEGGAKGLLLNHLAIDSNGRIVFDSSDDVEDASVEADSDSRKSGAIAEVDSEDDAMEGTTKGWGSPTRAQSKDIDIGTLGARFFPDLARLDEQDVCPSLRNFDLGDPARPLDIPFLKTPGDGRLESNGPLKNAGLGDETGIFLDGDNVAGFEDDDEVLGGFDIGGDAGFGEGGEAWAKNVEIEPQLHFRDVGFEEGGTSEGGAGEGIGVGDFDPEGNHYTVSIHHQTRGGGHEDILSYFDNALQKNWAGPEHWRIRRIKDSNKAPAPATSKRKEKEPFEIDFISPLDPALAELIYTPATSNAAISLPKTQWKSKTRNLLPDDKHFNSRQLLRLFLKPKARMGSRRLGFGAQQKRNQKEVPEGEMDEAFWARKENLEIQGLSDDEAPQGDYDANFFQDDGKCFPDAPLDEEEEFADAREAFSPSAEGDGEAENQGMTAVLAEGSQEGAFGTQLVTQSRRLRPEYVQYARVAKKVDVRRLKEELWRGIGFADPVTPQPPSPSEPPVKNDEPPLKFTSIMNNLQKVYPKQAMADISTSYCFICLLHLANEKGLTLGNEPGLEELSIQKDFSAEVTEGAS
ncbi:condensin complex subunit 2, partial [Lecanoromycetidae sp. Uapishka_2]